MRIGEDEEEERKCRETKVKRYKVQEGHVHPQKEKFKVHPTPTQTSKQATPLGSGPGPSLLAEVQVPKPKPKFTFRSLREQEERRQQWEDFYSTEGEREEPDVLEVPLLPSEGEDGADYSEQDGGSEYVGSLAGDEGGLPPTHNPVESLIPLVFE